MNWISLLLQVVNLRRSLVESQAMIEAAKNMAVKGKRTVVSLLLGAVAALFFFSGLLVAVIDLGLQIDRGSVHFSGLMISSLLLFGLGLALIFAGWAITRTAPAEAAPAAPPPNPREDRIKDLLEEFLTAFLTNLVAPKKDRS